jgi:hypothetical protein
MWKISTYYGTAKGITVVLTKGLTTLLMRRSLRAEQADDQSAACGIGACGPERFEVLTEISF